MNFYTNTATVRSGEFEGYECGAWTQNDGTFAIGFGDGSTTMSEAKAQKAADWLKSEDGQAAAEAFFGSRTKNQRVRRVQ